MTDHNPLLTTALTALQTSTVKTQELLRLVAQGDLSKSRSLVDVILPLHTQALGAIKALDQAAPPSPPLSCPSKKKRSLVDRECAVLESKLAPMHRQIAALRAMLNNYSIYATPPQSHTTSPKLAPSNDIQSVCSGKRLKLVHHSSFSNEPPPSPYLEIPADLAASLNGSVPRYTRGNVMLAGHARVLVHIPLAPRSIPLPISARYLNALVNSFKTKGSSKSILESIVMSGPLRPVSSSDLCQSLRLTAHWNVLNAMLRWWARPLVLVEILDKGCHVPVWETLVTASGLTHVPDHAMLVVLVGVTLVGFEMGIFDTSVIPPRDDLMFRITEYHAIVVDDQNGGACSASSGSSLDSINDDYQ